MQTKSPITERNCVWVGPAVLYVGFIGWLFPSCISSHDVPNYLGNGKFITAYIKSMATHVSAMAKNTGISELAL